ncbi:MAG: glycosyltransferase family 39 protein [Ignavibacteria bacterium]|nr:glycosyltransferase family 39 protein [Ignavibacteria bacterium]
MDKKTEKFLLFILFGFCLALRLTFISQKNLWFDEVFSWHLSMDSFYEIIVRTSNDIHPPLYYFTLKIWNFLFGDSVVSMRLLSSIFTSAAVFFIYPLSKRIMEPWKAFIVLLLYSVSPLNIYYSQEVRMAAMNLFLNAGSVYFLMKLTDIKHSHHRIYKDKYSLLYVGFTAAALYTHYFSFFILAAEVIYIAVINFKDRKQVISYLYLWLGVLAVYILWLPDLISHMRRGQSWRVPQTFTQVLGEYVNYVRDLNLGLYYYYTDLDLVNYITYFAAFVIITALVGVIIHRNKPRNNTVLLLLLILFVPLILAGIISFRQKIEFYRYLSILVPFITIFLVYGVSKWNFKPLVFILLLIYLSVNIYGITIHFSFKFKNDDYRRLIEQIQTDHKAGDRIYVEPHYNGWVIDYYKKQDNLQIPNAAFVRYGWNEVLDSIKIQIPPRFWVIMDYSSVDTTKYAKYIRSLSEKYSKDFNMTYYLAPQKVELYRFSQRSK